MTDTAKLDDIILKSKLMHMGGIILGKGLRDECKCKTQNIASFYYGAATFLSVLTQKYKTC